MLDVPKGVFSVQLQVFRGGYGCWLHIARCWMLKAVAGCRNRRVLIGAVEQSEPDRQPALRGQGWSKPQGGGQTGEFKSPGMTAREYARPTGGRVKPGQG